MDNYEYDFLIAEVVKACHEYGLEHTLSFIKTRYEWDLKRKVSSTDSIKFKNDSYL